MLSLSELDVTYELQVFQNRAGPVMAVFRVRDPRPAKASAYSAAMPAIEALNFLLSKSNAIVIDDPHGRLFG